MLARHEREVWAQKPALERRLRLVGEEKFRIFPACQSIHSGFQEASFVGGVVAPPMPWFVFRR